MKNSSVIAPNFTSIVVEEAHNPNDEQLSDKILAQQFRVQEEQPPLEEDHLAVHRIPPRGCLTSQGGPDGDPHGTLRQVIC